MIVFFFNDTATTEIYTLSLHDALPIFSPQTGVSTMIRKVKFVSIPVSDQDRALSFYTEKLGFRVLTDQPLRSEEHTSELQSRQYLVCRLLLEKKKNLCRALHNHRVRQA